MDSIEGTVIIATGQITSGGKAEIAAAIDLALMNRTAKGTIRTDSQTHHLTD